MSGQWDPNKAGSQKLRGGEIPAHAAGDASLYHTIFRAPSRLVVTGVSFVPDATLTGLDSPYYANFNLIKVDANGTPLTELANRDYKLGTDETALVERAFTIASAPVTLTTGQMLAIQRELVSSGVATPRCSTRITVNG